MWNHEKIEHPSHVIGSAVVIIFIVDIVAAVTRMNFVFVEVLIENGNELFSVLLLVVPSVVVGGQIGPRIIRDVDAEKLKVYITIMLVIVSGLMFSRVV
jgi:uncharacterized membrane protein YfcA